jgi:hypothetical protein
MNPTEHSPLINALNALRTPFRYLLFLLCALTLVQWLNVLKNPLDITILKPVHYCIPFIFSLAAVAIVILMMYLRIFFTSLSYRVNELLLILGLSLALAFAQYIWVQRFTSLGVFALNGGRYWVTIATHRSDKEAIILLKKVMDSNNYGVNNVQNAVNDLKIQGNKYRLFILLASIAPNEGWRSFYLRDAEKCQKDHQQSQEP